MGSATKLRRGATDFSIDGPVTVCSAIEGGNRLFNSSQIVECRGEAAATAPHPGDQQVLYRSAGAEGTASAWSIRLASTSSTNSLEGIVDAVVPGAEVAESAEG